ncbi:MAG: thiamine pyrophosphate-dependent enzyme [Sulfolobales archaeon]
MDVAHPLDHYLRVDRLPHMWCPGCGIGIAVSSLLRAINRHIEEGHFRQEDVATISGIGCTARATLYLNFDSAHVIHGRAIPFATGLKLVKPNLKVIVIGGDGDIAAIGGNHLLHAARRNMDLTVIMVNNMIYGMTGGQVAPTTPTGVYTTTTPLGNFEYSINVVKFVSTLNVNYLARASVTHPHLLEKYIYTALSKEGFSFVEVVSPCPEIFGRHIGYKDPVELFNKLRSLIRYEEKPSIEKSDIVWGKEIFVGEFINDNKRSFLNTLVEVMRYKV